MYTPPGTPRSRSFTRLTIRVGLLHFGQSVDFVVSIAFLRSPVFAIFAMVRVFLLLGMSLLARAYARCTRLQRRGHSLPSAIGVEVQRDSLHQVYIKCIRRPFTAACSHPEQAKESCFANPLPAWRSSHLQHSNRHHPDAAFAATCWH